MIRTGIDVPAAEGITLATDIIVPEGVPPRGAVVIRTPYGRGAHLSEGLEWARRGVAFLCQDVRGRHDSTGEWVPYLHERRDGAALLDWLDHQPWRPDRLVASGASYAAATAWALAAESAKRSRGRGRIHGVLSKVPTIGSDRVKRDPSGVLLLAEHLAWWGEHGASRSSRAGFVPALLRTDPGLLEHLPVYTAVERLGMGTESIGWSEPILRARTRAPYGTDDVVTAAELEQLDIATLHIGGWNDAMSSETLRHFSTVGAALANRGSRSIVMGPWGHDLSGDDVAGTRLGQVQVDWIESVLGSRVDSVIRIFDQGSRRWSSLDPGAATRNDRLTPTSDLALLPTESSRNTARFEFYYHAFSRREDSITLTSRPVRESITIWGSPRVDITVHSPATESDWAAVLSVIDPEETQAPVSRGVLTTFGIGSHTISMEPIHRTLLPHESLSLRISGSDFPRLARNLGGPDRYHGVAADPVRQQFSCLVTIPVLERTRNE